MRLKQLARWTLRDVRLGTLRKGAPRPANGARPGRDLDHFRFDPADAADFRLIRAFQAAHPTMNDIEIYLPFPTARENFDAWQEEWTASGLQHRCDGIHIYERGERGQLMNTGRACPGGCKQVGRMTVIVPALIEGAGRFGLVTLVTTSIHDIVELSQSLSYYEMMTGGDLRGAPFILSRRAREVSVPLKGRRVRMKKNLVYLEPSAKWVRKRLEAA